jgi:coenzyme PQQ precursor peptide PqqA
MAVAHLRSGRGCVTVLIGTRPREDGRKKVRKIMAWTTPTLVEICIGLEINGYLPAEF